MKPVFKMHILLYLLIISFAVAAAAEETTTQEPAQQSLFEAGLFLGSVSVADYPTSDQSRVRTIPAPLIRYYGDVFRADDKDGTRFRFLKNEKIDFDLSFGGSFSTQNKDNTARVDMPNLDYTLEIGPRILYYFYKNKDVAQIRIGIPYRGSIATNFIKWYGVGQVFAPTFQIDKYNFIIPNLDLSLDFTTTHINEGQADYFFQVDSQYQTPARLAYDAKAGFFSNDISVALKYKWNKKILIAATKYTDYRGSVNSESNLHRSNNSLSIFVGFGWIFYESDTKVSLN